MPGALHPLAWVAWVAAVCSALSSTRNPLHLGLVLLCVTLVAAARGLRPGMLRLAVGLVISASLFNLLLGRGGATVLARIPETWPLIGGPLTLESLVFGGLTGLALAGIFAAFGALQGAVPTRVLLDLLPPAFAPIAVTVTVAVSFLPATLRQLRAVREAQAVRGHRIRGLRDWSALLTPLLVGGLDRALQLAESLAARGFPTTPNHGQWPALLLTGGLALVVGGLLALAWSVTLLGPALLLAGGALLAGSLWLAGKSTPRTRYRRYRWGARDTFVVLGACAVIIAFLLPLSWPGRTALAYSPYPILSSPPFSPMIGIVTLALAAPGILLLLTETR